MRCTGDAIAVLLSPQGLAASVLIRDTARLRPATVERRWAARPVAGLITRGAGLGDGRI
jgi:hypothetical protein